MLLQGIILKENGKVGDAERMFIQVSVSIVLTYAMHIIIHEHIRICELGGIYIIDVPLHTYFLVHTWIRMRL